MNGLPILAQAVTETVNAAGTTVVPVDQIWQHITELTKLEALTFIAFGSVCLLYGWRVFKILVVICFAAGGLALGMLINDKIGGDNSPLLSVLISIVMAVVSVPLMRWAVSILGAIAGGFLTAGLWYACELPDQYLWAGATTGVVAGGMISFIVFRIAVMLFSSLGGSALIAAGILAMLHLYPQTAEQIQILVFDEKWFLPVALLGPTVIGVLMQYKFIKTSADWSV